MRLLLISRFSESKFMSDIEKAEKQQRENDLKNGIIQDKLKFGNKLLIQEIEFFMDKKTDLEEQLQKLGIEKENLEKDNRELMELRKVKNEINGLKLSVGFFNRQISVALHDLKIRKDKRRIYCQLFNPIIETTRESWQLFLRNEGLEGFAQKQLE